MLSCSKDGEGDGALVGRWSYTATDHIGTYTGYWVFNSDGTMVVNDRNDLMSGHPTAYSYNGSTKTLSVGGGLLVFQLVWNSSTEFHIPSIGRTFTKEGEIITNLSTKILGKWQLVERDYILITDGEICEYKNDGTFNYDTCSGVSGNGTYTVNPLISSIIITLQFIIDSDGQSYYINESVTLTVKSITNTELVLHEKTDNIIFKYKKIQ